MRAQPVDLPSVRKQVRELMKIFLHTFTLNTKTLTCDKIVLILRLWIVGTVLSVHGAMLGIVAWIKDAGEGPVELTVSVGSWWRLW